MLALVPLTSILQSVSIGSHCVVVNKYLPKSSYTATVSSSSRARETPVTVLCLDCRLRASRTAGPPRMFTNVFASVNVLPQPCPPEKI